MKRDRKSVSSTLHPEVVIASRTQAEQLLMSKNTGPAIRHIISIGAPGDPVPAGFELCAAGIRLEFFDDTGEVGPQLSDVEQVIDFGKQIQHEGGKLLVHCEAGISRSSAAALTVLATWLGTGKEQEAVDKTYAAQPHAWPNSQLVELADELLGRDGALVAVVAKALEALDVQELLRRYVQRMNRGE
ncbi:MAG: tyrosine phosphatase family protein [Acidiferrobacterales bacterium]